MDSLANRRTEVWGEEDTSSALPYIAAVPLIGASRAPKVRSSP